MTAERARTEIDFSPQIAQELAIPERGVAAVIRLLSEGATVPFIARYRKEMTGGLDEVQIRAIEERRAYLRDLEERRRTILKTLEEAGKLSDDLRQQILACTTKAALEDLYLPHKPKRRTRATIARERGLGPLADRILAQPPVGDPRAEAAAFVRDDKEVPEMSVADVDAALAGARDIVAEAVAERPEVRALVRGTFEREGVVRSQVAFDKKGATSKFEAYYEYEEPIATIPSHRYLAVRRGEQEGFLRVRLTIEAETVQPSIAGIFALDRQSPFAGELEAAIADSLRRLLLPSIETEMRIDVKMRADREAVEVFAANLRSLLLASPLGGKPVIAIDPGLRTGSKCTAIDATGKVLETTTIYPGQGERRDAEARAALGALIQRRRPEAIAVGNGTGGREAEAFVRAVLAELGERQIAVVAVNEAGASVYSASEIAREEMPDLDVTLRGAVSIGRRLQDPLAELVKIDPKAIGVGQYQHDVYQPLLTRKLDQVVESCVNHVGVDLNTASAPLLAQVAGIGPSLARGIVRHREEHGPFRSRRALLEVSGLGPRTFEQCAGFLRIRGGEHPLDASAVHPERYPLVERIAADLGARVVDLVGDERLAANVPIARYVGDGVGEPTLRDILAELAKPGRDPRQSFEPPRFRADVQTLEDLQEGMVLEGVVTNVTAFGAFIDIGVHQDGLCHISQLADRFVKDPHEVVKAGDRLRVRVTSVDLERRRIGLSARLGERPEASAAAGARGEGRGKGSAKSGERGPAKGGDRRGGGAGGGAGGDARDRRRGGAPTAGAGDDGFRNNPFARLLK
ncbi:MAG: RNA-binding transcriptional accessory protein [Myxococcales bacterium]|nr:RNA-binding transcriptional accessory protein [Myxococcales bacterium]